MTKRTVSCFLILTVSILFLPCIANAVISAKDKYFNAEKAYTKLLNNSKQKKYRDNWLSCIKKFQAVYKHVPSGPWAAAGMYVSGTLYYELHK